MLLFFQLLTPQLYIKSRKAPEPEGFVEHSSKLDDVPNNPLYVLWQNGEILKIFLSPDETISSANLKRGLASLFQYRTLDGKHREHDASGVCSVAYESQAPYSIIKSKYDCDEIPLAQRDQHPNPILGVSVDSSRFTGYTLNPSLLPIKIEESEIHELTLDAKPEVGATVTTYRILQETGSLSASRIDGRTVRDAIAHLQPGYTEVQIDLQVEPITCPESGCRTVCQKELTQDLNLAYSHVLLAAFE